MYTGFNWLRTGTSGKHFQDGSRPSISIKVVPLVDQLSDHELHKDSNQWRLTFKVQSAMTIHCLPTTLSRQHSYSHCRPKIIIENVF